MASVDERIKELRKILELTQAEFGKRIGLARNTIANYEIGTRSPMDQTLVSISREYKVSYNWLRDGTGEMYEKNSNVLIDNLVDGYNLGISEKEFIESFINLEENERKVLAKYLIKLIKEK